MKRVLLTGGSGFIGRNIREALGRRYRIYAPTSRELDLEDGTAVGDYLEEHEISHVIHAATINRARRERGDVDELSANLRMFYHLLSQAHRLEKIIYFGSGAEYDKRDDIVQAQECEVGQRLPLLNDYALSKYILNREASVSSKVYNLRLFGVYGKYEDAEHCFPSHLCRCALEGTEYSIRQNCRFDFLYIDDLMPPLVWCLEGKPRFHDYNVCSGTGILLSEMAETMARVSGRDLPLSFQREGRAKEYTGSNARLLQELPMTFTTPEDGLRALYTYYKR